MSKLNLPAKPPLVQSGRPIQVTSNIFPLKRIPNEVSQIFVYDVKIEAVKPKLRTWRENLRAMKYFLTHEVSYGSTCAYDGQALLYSSQKLPFDQVTSVQFNLPAASETPVIDKATGEKQGVSNRISLAPVNVINMDHMNNPQINELLSALNTVVRYCATLSHPSTKRVYYPVNGKSMDVEGAAKLLRSWFTTARLCSRGMSLNVDTSSVKILQDGNLVNVATKIMNWEGPLRMTTGPNGRMSKQDLSMLKRQLKKIRVETNHNPSRNQTFPIQEVSDLNSDTYEFTTSDGKTWTIHSYLRKTYNIQLRFPQLPVIGKSKNVFMPMEILDVVPGQIHPNKALSSGQTRSMMAFCKVRPNDRLRECSDQVKALASNNPIMDKFGYKIDSHNIVSTAHQLEVPKLEYFDKRTIGPNPSEGDWERDSHNVRFFKPAQIRKWKLIAFGRPEEYRWLRRFIADLTDTCKRKGMSVPYEPSVHFIKNENARIDDILYELGRIQNQDPSSDFILSTSRFDKSNAYKAIKNFCDVKAGLASQHFVAKKASNAKGSYFSNLALKINVKAGGINQTLGTPISYFKDLSICFGVDVTHPSPGSSGAISLAGVVSNIDQRCSRFIGSEIALKARQEVIDSLKGIIRRHVKIFAENNKGVIPRRVLYLRDGVADSQYKEVLDTELLAIQAAYKELTNGKVPQITFVVGQKRHHVRFAPNRSQPSDRSGNCPTGTVIDCPNVTRPDQFEFYLYGHSGLMGTSRPCRYVVIHDDFKFNVENLARTIHATSFTYQCATRAVSLPTPVYYAHKLADRARIHLSDTSSWSETGSSIGSSQAPAKDDIYLAEISDKVRQYPYFV